MYNDNDNDKNISEEGFDKAEENPIEKTQEEQPPVADTNEDILFKSEEQEEQPSPIGDTSPAEGQKPIDDSGEEIDFEKKSGDPLTEFIMYADPNPQPFIPNELPKNQANQMNNQAGYSPYSNQGQQQPQTPNMNGQATPNGQYPQNGQNPTYSYQVPTGGYAPNNNNSNSWQVPPYQPQTPPQQAPQQPQQTQWTYNDYGPLNNTPKGNYEPKKPKDGKEPKKPKKPRSPNFGLKVFAIVISVLFVCSIAGFGLYIGYGNVAGVPIIDNHVSSAPGNNDSTKPSMDIGDTPDKSADSNKDGVLSGSEINDKVSESVVGVVAYAKVAGYQTTGQGSGIVMTDDGYIITNAHVISDTTQQYQITKVEVILRDGKTYEAKIVGKDTKTDLAVLKISATGLHAAEFGDSDKLKVGDNVYVIGNPSGIDFAGSFTQGVVSSLNRSVAVGEIGTVQEYIQTDAAINPGNSGGAFINEYGQVVGISTAKLIETGYEGMGFAIPINSAKDIINSLIANGYVTGRPQIGIQYESISETLATLNGLPHGLRVVVVNDGSDAKAQGVKPGDIIFKMDGKETYDATTIEAVMKDKKPGDKIILTVYRVDEVSGRSSTFDITVVLGESAG